MRLLRTQNSQYQIFVLISVFLLGTGAGIMANIAAQHTTGLMLNGTYQFSVNGATVFYWATFGLCFIGALAGVLALVLSLTAKQEFFTTQGSLRSSPAKKRQSTITVSNSPSFR